jgi:hypothetical protein
MFVGTRTGGMLGQLRFGEEFTRTFPAGEVVGGAGVPVKMFF